MAPPAAVSSTSTATRDHSSFFSSTAATQAKSRSFGRTTMMTRVPAFLKTLYLFGKSDIPAAALPSMAIAIVLAGPPRSVQLFAQAFVWHQLHLLTFQVKNQINGVEEDRLAKPHRPIPSGRISPRAATLLYRVLFAAMWAAAVSAKTIPCTLTYSVAIVVYNEGGWAAVPVVKNVLGAVGLACYCWGTTVVFDHGRELHGLKALAVFLVGAIFATTGYAQDFRDRSADKMMGRRTIPLLLPQPVARWSLAASITAWTVGLLALWRPPVVAGIAFAAAGLTCLGGFLRSYEEEDDYVSYCWFGVWLLGCNLLPVFSRLRGEMY